MASHEDPRIQGHPFVRVLQGHPFVSVFYMASSKDPRIQVHPFVSVFYVTWHHINTQ